MFFQEIETVGLNPVNTLEAELIFFYKNIAFEMTINILARFNFAILSSITKFTHLNHMTLIYTVYSFTVTSISNLLLSYKKCWAIVNLQHKSNSYTSLLVLPKFKLLNTVKLENFTCD